MSITDDLSNLPYVGVLYRIIRIRIGNTGPGSTEDIIYEKEFLDSCSNERLYVEIKVSARYKWTPMYATFQRYDPSPDLDWITHPVTGKSRNQSLEASVNLIRLDTWNLN